MNTKQNTFYLLLLYLAVTLICCNKNSDDAKQSQEPTVKGFWRGTYYLDNYPVPTDISLLFKDEGYYRAYYINKDTSNSAQKGTGRYQLLDSIVICAPVENQTMSLKGILRGNKISGTWTGGGQFNLTGNFSVTKQ